jgi:O-antigen ligase
VGVAASIRTSGSWYLTALAVGVVLERFANYLWYEDPVLKGQAANILVAFAYFAVAGALWLALDGRHPARGLLLVFLVAMATAWLVHLCLYRLHGDAFNYTSVLYVPILLFLAIKPPTSQEARTAAIGFAWAVAAVLISTRALEMLGVLAIKPQSEGVIEFDTERYFLPLNDFLGIDGRWPGPFGHNGDTAMMGALLVVLAFAFWSRASWVFIVVGGLTLLLTNGRASMGAVAAGLIVMAMFVTQGPLARLSRTWRVSLGAIALGIGALGMYLRPAGLTGRNNIWPAFLELWQTSPLLGVGGSGIAVSGGLTQEFGHAHSLYIDELARYGLVGFVVQFGALAVGVVIACWAAGRGRPGPLGVLVAYLVTAVTEPRNSWITPSATGFLVILMVVAAAAELRATERGAPDAESTRRDDTVGSHP